MRLFIAVNFSRDIKDDLYTMVKNLKSIAVKGNFTLTENFHLTLAFIGDTDRLQDVKECMDNVQGKPFEMTLEGLGSFKRGSSCICWMGIIKNDDLKIIYSQLKKELQARGFPTEDREFQPHLTLGRDVLLKDGSTLEEISKAAMSLNVKVEKISLMKSERIKGKLTYTEIYERKL